MKMFNLGLVIALGVGALSATSASALTWAVNYTSAGNPASASLMFSTGSTMNSLGGYDITGVSGSVDGDTITSMESNPNAPFQATSLSNLFYFDNVLGGTPFLTNAGALFKSAAFEYNLYSSGAGYELYKAGNGQYLANSIGTATMAAVPEPASWALMVGGFGLVGATMRRRSTNAVTVSA